MTTDQQNSGGYPLDNLTYNLLTIIQEKSQALKAYDKYLRDAESDQAIEQLLQHIRQQDEQVISQLVQHLARRLGQSGSTNPDSNQSSTAALGEDETLTGRVAGEESTSTDLDATSGTSA